MEHLQIKMELKNRKATSKDELKFLFRRVCTNAYPATTPDGKPRPYRRDDLSRWAKEASDKNESHFYAEPTNPKQPNGKLRLCDPEYEYRLTRGLSEKEFAILFEK